jgi:hypothetical protein
MVRQVLDSLACMARRPILEGMGSVVELHEGDEVVLQHLLVPLRVHCGVLGQEIEATTTSSRERPPNNQGIRMFHGLHRKLAAVPFRTDWPLH